MARVGVIQPSFAQGELSDRLFGRVDIAQYQVGAAKVENYIVRPEGGLSHRHGTRFAGESRDHTKRPWIIPFIVSETNAFQIEFGNLYLRFWKNYAPVTSASASITGITQAATAVVTYGGADIFANGNRIVITGVLGMGQVNNREFEVANLNVGANTFELSGVNSSGYDAYTSGGTAAIWYEVTTPYVEADLPTLFTTQSVDTLYIVHGSYAPRTLVRTNDTSWALSTISQRKGPFATLNTNDAQHIFCTVTGTNYDPGDAVSIQSNADIFASGHVGSHMYLEERYPADNDVKPYFAGDRANTTQAVVGDQYSNAGHVYEVVEIFGATNFGGTVPPTHTDGEAWDGPHGATQRAKFRYLHSRNAVIELTSFTDSKNMSGTIRTRLPNGLAPIAETITNVTNSGGICRVTAAGHGYGVGDYVYITGVTGATQANGSWRTINNATNTFDLEGSSAPSAYTGGGTAKRYATWFWRHGAFSTARGNPAAICIHEQRLCYANTTLQPFGFWASKSGDYANFLPSTKDDGSVSYNVASNKLDPIKWMESGRDLILGTLSQEQAAFGGGLGDPITPSNTRIVPQSGEGSGSVHQAKVGNGVIFVNRAGRKVFSLGYRTDVDSYLAEDLIELAEHLTVDATITQLEWAKNPFSVLWCLRSNGSLLSLTYRPEQRVIAWARHPMTNAVIESIAVIPSSDGKNDDLWLVVRRTINGSTKRYIEFLAAPFEPTSPTDKNLMGFVDCGLRYSGAAATVFSGLFHLEGQTVKVVSGGAVHPDRTVSGGKITLENEATNVWVGLGYTARLRTLRWEGGAVGTAQGKTKRVPRVTARVRNAIGGMVGPADEVTMDELVRRDLADPMDGSSPLYTGDVDCYLATGHDEAGQIAIVQSSPMPLDIISLMPVLAVQES